MPDGRVCGSGILAYEFVGVRRALLAEWGHVAVVAASGAICASPIGEHPTGVLPIEGVRVSRTDNTKPFRIQALDPRRPAWVNHRADCLAGGRCDLAPCGRGQPDGPRYSRCWRSPVFFGGMWAIVRDYARAREASARTSARIQLGEAVKVACAAIAAGRYEDLDDLDILPVRHRHSGRWDAL